MLPTNDKVTISQQSQAKRYFKAKEANRCFAKRRMLLGICYLVLACLYTFLLTNTAQADASDSPLSFYDDQSWHGGWHFAQLVYASGAATTRHQNNASMKAQGQGEILVLIAPNPQQFRKSNFDAAIANGYRLLIFDNSKASIEWLSDIYPGLRVSQGQDPKAAHINANPMLPVVTTGLNLKSPLGNKRLAFNHPQSLAGGNALIGNSNFAYALTYPKLNTSNPQALRQASALVFRDQSLPSSLMLGKLDNRSFLLESLRLLCPKLQPCRVHLFEPRMTPSFQAKQDSLGSVPDRLKAELGELKSQIERVYRQNQEAIDRFPWPAIGVAFILFWTLLAILMAYPLTRD